MILSFKEQFVPLILPGRDLKASTKIHTIREDKSKRWKPGMKIHFWKGNPRNVKQNPYQFMEGVCKSVQAIDIRHHIGHVQIDIDGECYGEVFHHGLDDVYEFTTDLIQFVKNDGFECVEDFLKWFDTDFSGRIIHWTDFSYK